MVRRFLSITLLFLPFFQVHAQQTWEHTSGPEGVSSYTLLHNNQFAFQPDFNGFYRTSDGMSWEKLPTGNLWPLAVTDSVLYGLQGYGVSNGGVYKFLASYDQGDTWVEGNLPPTEGGTFTKMAACSHGVYVPGDTSLYRSTDGGNTWDSLPLPADYCREVWAYGDKLYTASSQQFFLLNDDLYTWTDITPTSPPLNNDEYTRELYADDSTLIVSTNKRYFAKPHNSFTWHTHTPPLMNIENPFVRLGTRIYKVDYSLRFSENNGVTWTVAPYNPFNLVNTLAVVDGKLIGLMFGQSAMRLDVAAGVMHPINDGLESAAVYHLVRYDSLLWAACGNGVFSYNLHTQTWNDTCALPIPVNLYSKIVVGNQGRIAVLEDGKSVVHVSTDDGQSWTTRNIAIWGGATDVFWVNEVLYATTTYTPIIRSSNYGAFWTEVTGPFDAVFFNGKYYGWNSSNALVSTIDNGVSWQDEPDPNLEYISEIFTSGDRLFVLGSKIGPDGNYSALYMSVDGQTWHYANEGLPEIHWGSFPTTLLGYETTMDTSNGAYYLISAPIGVYASFDTCRSWVPLERDGKMAVADSSLYLGRTRHGVFKKSLVSGLWQENSGTVFNDANTNGLFDAGEAVLPGVKILAKEAGSWFPYISTTTDSVGNYLLKTFPERTYTIQPMVNSPFVTGFTPANYVVDEGGSERHFGVQFSQQVSDGTVSGMVASPPRPGFEFNTHVHVSSLGSMPANGKLVVRLGLSTPFVSADPMPSEVFTFGADSLVWDLGQLPSLTSQSFRITSSAPVSVPLGSAVELRARFVPSTVDADASNNVWTTTETVVGSYDPNDKIVSPPDGLTNQEILEGKELVYTIRFQNTGTYLAEQVRITDLLDTLLDHSTLRLVATSHPITSFELKPGGLLEVVYDGINLPDSSSNEVGSHGFVTFALQRRNVGLPYFVFNSADIYFDFNAPIRTNSTVTRTLSNPVHSNEPQHVDAVIPSLSVYPNPASDNRVTLDTRGLLEGSGFVMVTDALGIILLRVEAQDWSKPVSIQLPFLPTGVYGLSVTAGNGSMRGKLVVQR